MTAVTSLSLSKMTVPMKKLLTLHSIFPAWLIPKVHALESNMSSSRRLTSSLSAEGAGTVSPRVN